MPEINDVVRHVILRIQVDQAGLAESLAAARAKLAALKDAEKGINKDREASSNKVKDAIEAQNKALGENKEAHEAAQRAASGKDVTQQLKDQTKEIKEQTSETKKQTVEEAKADSIRTAAQQKRLDAQQKRRTQRAKDAQDERASIVAIEALKDGFAAESDRRDEDAAAKRLREAEKAEAQAKSHAESQKTRDKEAATRAAERDKGAAERAAERDAKSEVRKDARSVEDVAAAAARRGTAEANQATAEARTAANKVTDATKLAALQDKSLQDFTSRAILNDEKIKAAQSRTQATSARTAAAAGKAADAQKLLDDTHVDRSTAISETAKGKTEVAQQRTEAATSIAGAAQSREANAADKTKLDMAERRRAAEVSIARVRADLNKMSVQGEILEQRLLATTEARQRAAEKEAAARRRSQTLIGSVGALFSDVAVLTGRGALTAPKAASQARRATSADPTSLEEVTRRATTTLGRTEKVFDDFARRVGGNKGIEGYTRRMTAAFDNQEARARRFFDSMARGFTGVSERVRGFVGELNRPRQGGSGGSLFTDLLNNFSNVSNKLTSSFSGMGRHLISFQSLIVAVIAAMGPLAAILGAVGAAALGLASNLAALAGSVAALPGLIGAAVSAFGALAVVMGPVKSVFSAYSAAQKEATTTTHAAITAALDYRSALLAQQEAQLNVARAKQDLPRAQLAYADAVKTATRNIQDYLLARQKLKYDQEGADLGVESAQQDYRRALADPTKNNLDRRVAAHGLLGAEFDQRDQKVAGQRLMEDSTEALKKGVYGSDEVIAAKRNEQDAVNNLTQAYIDLDKAKLAEQKAKAEKDAGGTAAAALAAALDKLPPKTRKVAQAILDLAKGPYKVLRDQLSENIFGPISGETGKFSDLLKSLGDFLTPTSKAIGKFAKSALDLFTNPAWKEFFSEQGKESGYIVGQLGDALLSTADAFRSIMEVARPFTRFVVDGIKGMADSFKAFATSDKGRWEIGQFLLNTRRRMQELLPIVKNFASGIGSFLKALNSYGGGQDDFTTWFNKGLLKASKTFKELGKQAEDPNSGFQKWLRNVRPLLHDVVGFISAAAGFFGKLFSDPRNLKEASSVLETLSTKWLPALAEIFGKLSESGLVSKLAAGIGAAFDGINKFFDAGGLSSISAFGTIVESVGSAIGTIGTWVDKLTKSFPLLGTAISGVGTALAIVFGAALLTKITGLSGLIKNTIAAAKGAGKIVGSIYDRQPGEVGRVRGAVQNTVDSAKDSLLGRDRGTSTARRNIRNRNKNQNPTVTGTASAATATPSKTSRLGRVLGTVADVTKPVQIDPTNTGGVLPTLYRIEKYAQQIALNTRGGAGGGGNGGSGGADGSGRGTGNTGPKGGGGGGVAGGGSTSGTEPGKSNRGRSRGIDVPNRPGNETGFGSVGASTVTDGVDPNSEEGKAQRTAARKQATENRLGRESTPLGRAERDARLKINPPRATNRFKGKAGAVGNLLKNAFGTLGSALAPAIPGQVLGDLETVEAPPARRPTYTPAGQHDTFTPYDFDAVAPVQGPARPPRQRGPKGQFLPANRQSADYTGLPYSDDDLTPKIPTRRGKQATVPGLNDAYTVAREPQARDARGRLLPRVQGEQQPLRPYVFEDQGAATPSPAPRPTPSAQPTPSAEPAETPRPTTSARPAANHRPATDTPNLDVLSDIMNGGDGTASAEPAPQRKGFFRRLFDRTREVNASDEGAATIGSLPSTGSRRDRTTRPSTRPATSSRSRFGRLFGRGRGVVGVVGAAAAAVGGVGGDAEYVRGYDDGLAAGHGRGGGLGGAPDLGTLSDLARGEDAGEDGRTPSSRRRGLGGEEGTAGRRGTVIDGEFEETGRSRPPGRLGRMFSRGRGRGVAGVGSEVESLARSGGRLGGLGRLGGGLARGMVGGIGGLVAGAAATLGGDYLINKYVKNDADASSLQRGLGAVSQGAGIGSMIGSFLPIPGGGLIGGAIGGLAGGAYSLFKDKNLRNFVGDKLGGAAKSVGGFFGGVGSSIAGGAKSLFNGAKDLFTGGDAKGAGGAVATAMGPLGGLLSKTDFGKAIFDSISKGGTKIADFFTKTIPGWWHKGVSAISDFFTKTLPSLPGRAFDAFFRGVGRIGAFFTKDLPRLALAGGKALLHGFLSFEKFIWIDLPKMIFEFFTKTVPHYAMQAGKAVLNAFLSFEKFLWVDLPQAVFRFFTKTLPELAGKGWGFLVQHLGVPLHKFITKDVPKFFTDTIPKWFAAAPKWFKTHVIDPITGFFTTTLPDFFTKTLPGAIAKLPGVLYDNLIQPVLDFFGGLAGHIGDFLKGSWGWAKGLFSRAAKDTQEGYDSKNMSGGLIAGVYQGIEDKARVLATPGEFMVRRSVVQKPGAKAFLDNFNEGRIDPAQFYSGLSAASAPQVMSIVPPDAQAMTRGVPSVVNTTVNHAPVMGDVTINNPVRERSEHSLRRQVQIAAIRHRR